MKIHPLLVCTLLAMTAWCARDVISAEPGNLLAEVTAADDARISAMRKPEKGKLAEIFSNELHYAHSTGVVDTKNSFMEVLLSGRTKYVGYEYEQRTFKFPAPGIATMTGRARVRVETAAGPMENLLSFLAVWRLEDGKWRFLAWQSCKVPPPTPNS